MSMRQWAAGVIAGILLIPTAVACAQQVNATMPDTPKPAALKRPAIRFEKYTLPNGLTVIAHEDHRLPLVAVNVWYHVGALNERTGRTGFAHLFEHMMFEGSEHVGEKAHIKIVQAAGSNYFNGTTNFDRTNYYETLPSNQLELALWLESDRMGFLMEGLDRTRLVNQKDVVRNERRQGEGRPYYLAEEEMYHQLFPEGHPYRGNVIGSHADIEAARIADVRDFHQQYYVPNNASIAVAGDFDPRQLKELLTKYFGPIPRGPAVAPVTVVTPPITTQRRATVTDTVRLRQLNVSWLTPSIYAPGSDETDIAMYVLGGSKSSRLSEVLMYKAQLAQSARCRVNELQLTGIAECVIQVKPGVKIDEVEAIVWAEIDRLKRDGPTQAEIDSAKAFELTNQIVSLERVGWVADTLNQYNHYTGDPGYFAKDIADSQAVTVAGVEAAAAKYLNSSSAVVITCVPGNKVLQDVPRSPAETDAGVKIENPYSQAFEAAQAWRKTQPAAGPDSTFHLPVPKVFALKNGLKVYTVTDSSLPLLTVMLTTRAGSENNTFAKAGLAGLTASALAEATTTRNREELTTAEERIGMRLFTTAAMDGAKATFTTTSNHTDEAMALLADVVEHPAFALQDLNRVRDAKVQSIPAIGDAPMSIAMQLAPSLLYGEQPYGVAQSATPASLKAITRDDVVAFYKAHYGPGDSALTFVGDISEAQARHLAEQYFGGWTGAVDKPVSLPPPPAAPSRHVVLVDKRGASQSALFAVGLGLPIGTPDLQRIEVMNYALGGGFNSRINMNLREQHGYTYGVQSQYAFYREGGMFSAGGPVRADATGAAAKEMISEISRFAVEPPNAAELKEAKEFRIRSLPAMFEATSDMASTISSLFLYDRPVDYFSTLPEKYRSISAEDVARTAKQDLHPDHLILIVVGDRSKIEPGLRDANLGPIEFRSVSGELIADRAAKPTKESPDAKP
jgi:zinc protease